jgi:hypothetical protein
VTWWAWILLAILAALVVGAVLSEEKAIRGWRDRGKRSDHLEWDPTKRRREELEAAENSYMPRSETGYGDLARERRMRGQPTGEGRRPNREPPRPMQYP